jgi:hypothetical protein
VSEEARERVRERDEDTVKREGEKKKITKKLYTQIKNYQKENLYNIFYSKPIFHL